MRIKIAGSDEILDFPGTRQDFEKFYRDYVKRMAFMKRHDRTKWSKKIFQYADIAWCRYFLDDYKGKFGILPCGISVSDRTDDQKPAKGD